MLVFGIIAICTVACIAVCIGACIVIKNDFWNRQNFMEKINRKF